MGIPDNSLLDLIEKVKSWVSGGAKELSSLSEEYKMADDSCNLCGDCGMNFKETCFPYHCQSCRRVLCRNCLGGHGSSTIVASGNMSGIAEARIRSCKFCSPGMRYSDKIYPSESPRQSPEPPSQDVGGERFDDYSPNAVSRSSFTLLADHPSPASFGLYPSRSDEEEGEDSPKHFFSASSEYGHDTSDVDSSSLSARHEFYGFQSVGSSPSDSPSRVEIASSRIAYSVQLEQGGTPKYQNDGRFDREIVVVSERPELGTQESDTADDCPDDSSIYQDDYKKWQKPLDFESNRLIWSPPPPDDEDDEAESNFFAYDDEDDDIGEAGITFSCSSSLSSVFPAKEKQNEGQKEPLRAVVQGHFRALVSQLLQGEGISGEDWLDIVTRIAWQAANFVKPDTRRGGSMDPGDYVKIKCIASGRPSESTFIKGVVCTKNIKHKRMTSQYKNARLLILGGALEYQRVANQLASFDTLLQQEIDHLKMVVAKIEAHHPNVLLVEKSVSSYAQEYLLAKDISLVLNVKRPLLERIARCSGALITPSIDHISSTRLGHCELFRLERVSEEFEAVSQFNRKPIKTLMFFEGCPRRLGCTVLLKGSCREELKKVKHVVQYAVFAAYHLSLETSFLADEGASLPKIKAKTSIAVPERTSIDNVISVISNSVSLSDNQGPVDGPHLKEGLSPIRLKHAGEISLSDHSNVGNNFSPGSVECNDGDVCPGPYDNTLVSNVGPDDLRGPTMLSSELSNYTEQQLLETHQEERLPGEIHEKAKSDMVDEYETSSEYYSASDSHQSILVSFSSRCVLNGTVCERSRLLRIKFYGCFDKPLGRYLLDDLFDQTACCRSCKEPAEAHVLCYTHQQGNLTINVRRLPSVKLPGERDGKIWMWHRCLRCAHRDGIPPATRRVVMSDAAWGLSFGKFLELSFSNHATANRVASCGHSLQRDCLRYYGFGSMVAFFRYSPIDILSVRLPPSVLEFNGNAQQEWMRKEAAELLTKTEALYGEIMGVLNNFEQKCTSFGHEPSDSSVLHDHIMELKDLLIDEQNDYNDWLQPTIEETSESDQTVVDILELNRLRHSILVGFQVWDRKLSSLDSLLKTRSYSKKSAEDSASCIEVKGWENGSFAKDSSPDCDQEEEVSELKRFSRNAAQSEESDLSPDETNLSADPISNPCHHYEQELYSDKDSAINGASMENIPSPASSLSDRIDSVWTGTAQLSLKSQADEPEADLIRQRNVTFPRLLSPARVYSFDSAVRIQERIRKGLPPSSLHLSNLRSFHASGDYRNMVRDPLSNVQRTYSQMSPRGAQKLNISFSSTCSFISAASLVSDGARFLLPQSGQSSLVVAVYDNEPTSIISYALCSKAYEDSVAEKPNQHEGGLNASGIRRETSAASNFSAWQSFGSLDLDYMHYGSYGSEDASSTIGVHFTDPKSSPHIRISFEDDSSTAGGTVKFSVTCYFAKDFDALRKKCCPGNVDFVRSLSRCKRWSAQGGKSNVYFAKSLDDRFIIKQVTKTELESFEEFASQYFKYLTEPLSSGSPTCLAKILGIYQVTVKHLKGGKETKMDLMVMENLFFKRSISKVYDLKGSLRSRYNSDTTGTNKVLLDMNLLETLRTNPIFLGRKAKRTLERAVWNDTSFLASVDVMDYSLLVGVDEERKELVLGIIDFMRQYTWDKHLETWVKASGILGGPKNASPTIISPLQYKRRFRKAMTTYFLTVPDQWSS